MSEPISIGWHRLAWQMARHLCGPNRAFDFELARQYDREIERARAQWRAHQRSLVLPRVTPEAPAQVISHRSPGRGVAAKKADNMAESDTRSERE